jgi:hypothetical protein
MDKCGSDPAALARLGLGLRRKNAQITIGGFLHPALGKAHYIGYLLPLVEAVHINVSYAPPWERHSGLYFNSRVANQDSGKHAPITSAPFGGR